MASIHRSVDLDLVPRRAATGRGRPTTSENRQVSADILRAAEACLEKKNPQDISTKEIAALAGTRSAMIYYYFGSKDGLLAEIIRLNVEDILEEFRVMQEAIRRNELQNPTREMIGFLAAVYSRRPALCRILTSEQLREESPLTECYLRHWGARARKTMTKAMSRLSKRGYYRKDIEVDRIFAMIRSVVFFPLIARVHLSQTGEAMASYFDDAWIDFTTEVFDSYLRPRR